MKAGTYAIVTARQPVKTGSPVVESVKSPHNSVSVRLFLVVILDILCSDRTIIEALVNKLVLGVGAVTSHLHRIVHDVVRQSI